MALIGRKIAFLSSAVTVNSRTSVAAATASADCLLYAVYAIAALCSTPFRVYKGYLLHGLEVASLRCFQQAASVGG